MNKMVKKSQEKRHTCRSCTRRRKYMFEGGGGGEIRKETEE